MSSTDDEVEMGTLTDQALHDRLEKEIAAVKNGISALSGEIAGVINAFARTAAKRARRAAKQTRDNVDAAMSEASESTGAGATQDAPSLEETLEDVITQRPLAAVGIAVGLGFLIGLTWRR